MDSTPQPHWLTYVMAALGLTNLVQVVVLTFRRESKDERRALVARVEALERKADNHDLRLDTSERRFGEIMAELGKLPALHTTVATVANDVKHMSADITEIKTSLSKLSDK